jgi:hypothetical protein
VNFSGSMWRVKQGSMSMAILPQPMMYCDWINRGQSALNDNMYVQVGSIIIVADDELFCTDTSWRRKDSSYKFQTFRRVVAPALGYLNSTYFNKDSLWLERIA